MAAETVQANYEVLEKVSKEFSQIHGNLEATYNQINSYSQQLCFEGWEGEAARKFDEEMRSDLMPRVKKLCETVELASRCVADISQLISEAENQASALFNK